MRKDIIKQIDFINRVYDFNLNIDKWDGVTYITRDNGREIIIGGTEKECASYLAGIEDTAQWMANRHGLIYGGF